VARGRRGEEGLSLNRRHNWVGGRSDRELSASGQSHGMCVEAVADVWGIVTMPRSGRRLTGRNGARHLSRGSMCVTVVGVRQQRLHSRAQEPKRGEDRQDDPSPGRYPYSHGRSIARLGGHVKG